MPLIRCPDCPRRFGDANALFQHARFKHGKNPRPIPREQSLASIAVEAQIKRACGEPLDPFEESLLA